MRTRPGQRLEFPTCPFCGAVVRRPEAVAGIEMPGGRCGCQGVYVMDVRGQALGEALLDALTLLCGGNPDLGWQLEPGEDYEERQVLGYDHRRHVVIGSAGYRSGLGALIFVRLLAGGLERAGRRAGLD